MSQVSRRFISPKIEERIAELFISAIIKCNSHDITVSLINDLLTKNEKIILSKRLSIAFLLLEDYDFRSISIMLKVSTTTVNLVSIKLKQEGEGIRKIIEKIKSDESMEDIYAKFGDAFLELLSGKNKSLQRRVVEKSRQDRQKQF